MISMIVAVSDDMGIGAGNRLLWSLPSDMRRFRSLTTGNTVIMGKKTWFSLPSRPLKGRKNIVLTDKPDETVDGGITAYSVADALEKSSDDKEVFIIGGGSVYSQFMPYADRLYITHVHATAPCDTWFPAIDPEEWDEAEREDADISENNGLAVSYVTYLRKKRRY